MVSIKNCNNIENGHICISKNHLNIKYAFNGTGKSTISKAIKATIDHNQAELESLKPFKYKNNDSVTPSVTGLDDFKKVMIFNEEYVEQYVFQNDELVKNSFEIFIRSKDYDKHMESIEALISNIHQTFDNDDKLRELITDLQEFLNSYGNTKKGYASSSIIGKGLGKGNKLSHIPTDIVQYSPFLTKSDINVKWLKWQLQGKDYYVEEEICPFCATDIHKKTTQIDKIRENFDTKEIDSLNKIIEIFERFEQYFSSDTNEKIKEISKNITGISTEQKEYLNEIRGQVNTLKTKLEGLYNLNYINLNNPNEKVSEIIGELKVDLSFIEHLDSQNIREKINKINKSVDDVLRKIGKLQGEVNQQRLLIEKTIERYKGEINSFLKSAGYNYNVNIEEENGNFKLRLFHNDCVDVIPGNERHLSYGERNAFALALFMYSALSEKPDLIILDDPISSFDGNKKFAIINMLFMGPNSLKDKTVLLLTHEFSIVIDSIYNFKSKILPTPVAYFVSTNNGQLNEEKIQKDDIKSFVLIANEKINSSIDIINKLIYLRRLLELEENKNLCWNLLSSLFHKRTIPTKRTDNGEIEMSQEEIINAENEINNNFGLSFSYMDELTKINDFKIMKNLYNSCCSNYEKLQIFRIIYDGMDLNDVVKKFINETYHIENDYIFQLDPSKYDTIPQYIINFCDEIINNYKLMTATIL